ncbi:uncharacterized protein N7529_007606 [Penicillium soppii]|uniref:uncharacterized protein n=1 Tax=Penicillium soppii TaxID=69789 RepID=UPI0025465CD9|nr:uncharacterized protein N7529_007606 [Penicillium soppii]KAJ5860296.1 hypothetical protein N7529_007606 [Penicillium soppii]
MTLSRLRRILTWGHTKEPSSDPGPKETPHPNMWERDEKNGAFNSLSEVAAPYPVERVTDDEQARRESLERNISQPHSRPNLSNN